MDKSINNNGHPYVDLGLPSGTLWAACNVGASKSSKYGLYFQWGDTQGYTKEQVGKEKSFTWNDYKFSVDGSSANFSKYTTEGNVLDLEDDSAHINMGGDWHMPTYEQIKELRNSTTSEWTTIDGIGGMTFTSKNDESKFIFIPAVGGAWDGFVYNSGIFCYIWSSMLSKRCVDAGQDFFFNPEEAYQSLSIRSDGFPVRGVIG